MIWLRPLLAIALCIGPLNPVSGNTPEADRSFPPQPALGYPYRAGTLQLGPRPQWLVENLQPGPLKRKLQECLSQPAQRSEFSIGHRGAPLQFPEHTRESYQAAATMGAGIIECDVTFTSDGTLVCRHAQCDLHSTTDILTRPELAKQCSRPFTPAVLDTDTGIVLRPASAECCASDLSLEDFLRLRGKMEGSNPAARTPEEFQDAIPEWRTGLYNVGTLLTHAESIRLFRKLGVKMIPELKAGKPRDIARIFGSQSAYAKKMIEEYRRLGIAANQVYPQSFNLEDIRYWIEQEPDFGKQVVYLDGRYHQPDFDPNNPDTWDPGMGQLAQWGVATIAPPLWVLLTDKNDALAPSRYFLAARHAGLDVMTWTLERSPPSSRDGAWYYQTVQHLINTAADQYRVLELLNRHGVRGVFSDWPATTTLFANCFKRQ